MRIVKQKKIRARCCVIWLMVVDVCHAKKKKKWLKHSTMHYIRLVCAVWCIVCIQFHRALVARALLQRFVLCVCVSENFEFMAFKLDSSILLLLLLLYYIFSILYLILRSPSSHRHIATQVYNNRIFQREKTTSFHLFSSL